uniref:Uncharacterized protein n=1 Tax=viral metagenome TaxID=1070528 RepID=A0A6H1ZTP5_9ZZZZ
MDEQKPKLSFVPEKPTNVISINPEWIINAEDFLSDIKNNAVTHGVIIYRKTDGTIVFCRFAEDHSTYLMGLLLKGAIRLGLKDEWEDNETF